MHIVKNGVEAIAQWQQWQPHLIFMDIQMPVMDGYEAIQQIRLEEQKKRDGEDRGDRSLTSTPSPLPTKIIALTAYAFEEDRTASLHSGCDDFIAKPFTETELFEIITRHLGVRYCYAHKTSPEAATSERKSLTPQDLNNMPLEWIAQVHEAALDLNDRKIQQLMTQIPQQEQMLIEGITFLVDHFQFEVIATLTQPFLSLNQSVELT